MAKGAFFHDIRWVPDAEDPENKKTKVVIPVEKWPTLQQAADNIQKVINIQVAVHQDKKTGATYLRGYTEEFGSGQFSLFSLRMQPVKTADGEMEAKMVLDPWMQSSGTQSAGSDQARKPRESSIDERLKAASTVVVKTETEAPAPAPKAESKSKSKAKSSK